MSLGGHGTANMTGNIAPAEMASISRPWDTPDVSVSFREGYLGLLPMLHYSYSAINPVAIKSLMKAVGLPVGDLRRAARPGRRGAGQGPRIVRELGLDAKYGFSSAQLKAA